MEGQMPQEIGRVDTESYSVERSTVNEARGLGFENASINLNDVNEIWK